jgi:hypothetical protein
MAEASDEQLVRAFSAAAHFLKDKCEREGWHWSSNFLREFARCSTTLQFANARSPTILRMVKDRYPELRGWIEIGTRKSDVSGELF